MAGNQNVSVHQLRAELREAGWTPTADIGQYEVWARGPHQVRFVSRSGPVGPKQVHWIRKAVALAALQEPTGGGSTAARREAELIGPATPDVGSVFLTTPAFRPALPPGTRVAVTDLDPLIVCVVPGGVHHHVEVWAAEVAPVDTPKAATTGAVKPRPPVKPRPKRRDRLHATLVDAGRQLTVSEIMAVQAHKAPGRAPIGHPAPA